jgi:hypothetical protein
MTTIDTHLQSLRNNDAPKLAARITAKPAPSKAATVEKLLARPRGATTAEMMVATTWQNHSVRAFLSGIRKKGRIPVKEPRKTGEVAYRLAVEQTASVQALTDSEAE